MKRTVLIGLLVLTLIALLTAGTWAWFTARDEAVNTFTAGTVEVEIVENYTPVIDWAPGTVTTKEVKVKSKGSKATYVRVSLTPLWGSEDDGQFVAEPGLPVDNVTLNWNESNWVYVDFPAQGGGWYYYKSILAAGGETSLLLNSVTLADETDDRYQGKVLQIVVNAEAVQASHEAYKDAWGLDALPAGVQVWSAP
ncbi:MAG: hypothetical protein GYA86_10255 [Firmicutes bacterium]|nr:hypothetical protein [Bacillota bacterium]